MKHWVGKVELCVLIAPSREGLAKHRHDLWRHAIGHPRFAHLQQTPGRETPQITVQMDASHRFLNSKSPEPRANLFLECSHNRLFWIEPEPSLPHWRELNSSQRRCSKEQGHRSKTDNAMVRYYWEELITDKRHHKLADICRDQSRTYHANSGDPKHLMVDDVANDARG